MQVACGNTLDQPVDPDTSSEFLPAQPGILCRVTRRTSGYAHRILSRLSNGIGATARPLASRYARHGQLAQQTGLLGSLQYPFHHRCRHGPPRRPQKHHQLVLTPSRALLAQLQHSLRQLRVPTGLYDSLWPAITVLQRRQVIRVVPSQPAVEGVRRYAEVAARLSGVAPIRPVPVDPFQTTFRFQRQLALQG